MNPWEASVPEWITAGASVAALVGLGFVWVQLRVQKQQLIRDLENDYVQRYWQIRDHIDAARRGSKEERRWRFAYLRLCEDQIDLRRRGGGVTDRTWDQWDAGMRAELKRLPIYHELVAVCAREELVGVRALLDEPSP